MDFKLKKLSYWFLVLLFMLSSNAFSQINSKYNNFLTSNAIAAGSYMNTTFNTRPLLAFTNDGGTTWNYPTTIISQLPADISTSGFFTGARCSRFNCLASGQYQRTTPAGIRQYPLLANSQDAAATWTYASIISNLPNNFTSGGFLTSPWCSGPNCVVGGSFVNATLPNETRYPLLAHSTDGGATWDFPSSIVTTLPVDFANEGRFTNVTCVRTDCVAVGQYQSIVLNKFLPLLATSHDGGATWSYPTSILATLPPNYDNGGIFNFASCSLTTCVAAGSYQTVILGRPRHPLVAVSHDGGSTWTYPSSVRTDLPDDFVDALTITHVSCNANNCIVVGEYESSRQANLSLPLLLISHDQGNSWNYPTTVISNMPPDLQNISRFNGSVCNRYMCLAVGQYQSSTFNGELMPMLASSVDGGRTWTYPSSILDHAPELPFNILNGVLNSVSCNVSDCIAQGQYQSKRPGVFYYPLLAVSHDAGRTWTYPMSIFNNLPADYFGHGVFAGGNSSWTLKKNKK